MELAALAQLAFHLDGAAHGVHNVFRDGHAQAGALGPADPGAVLPDEGLEDLGLELRGHADAVVLDHDVGPDVALSLGRFLLVEGDLDESAVGGEFQGVAQDV